MPRFGRLVERQIMEPAAAPGFEPGTPKTPNIGDMPYLRKGTQ